MVKCEQRARRSGPLCRLELRGNGVVGGGAIPLDVEDVGLAADLAVLNVVLAGACRRVDGGVVLFAASGALERGGVQHQFAAVTAGRGAGDGLGVPRKLYQIGKANSAERILPKMMGSVWSDFCPHQK